MRDLGSLGGAYGFASAINNGGQIVGQSSIPSDPGACNGFPDNNDLNCHATLWDKGSLIDLTTSSIGGSPEWVAGINDAGEIVGSSSVNDLTFSGFLGTGGSFTQIDVPGALRTRAFGINGAGQIVGSFDTGGFSLRHTSRARSTRD